MTAAQTLLQMLEKAKVAQPSYSDVRGPLSDATNHHLPSAIDPRPRSGRPSQRRRPAQSLCFMLVLSIDLGKVSKDLITGVTRKLSCANSSYRLGKIQPCPVKVMAKGGFVRQLWSLWVKRFLSLFCPGVLAPLAPSTQLTVEENKNRLLTYSCNLSI